MHTDIKEGDHLSGKLALTLTENKTFREFCEKHFNNFDPDIYDPIAIRLFHGKETMVTLYALDKIRQEGTNFSKEKIPVKKFKSGPLSLNDVLPFIFEFNFTLSIGNHNLDDMEVFNK